MNCARAGTRRCRSVPEELLPRWPTDPKADPDVASLLFEDFLQRRQRGEEPSASEYEERFPEHRDSLADLFRQRGGPALRGRRQRQQRTLLALPGVGRGAVRLPPASRNSAGAPSPASSWPSRPTWPAARWCSRSRPSRGRAADAGPAAAHAHRPDLLGPRGRGAGLRAVCMPYFGGASLSRRPGGAGLKRRGAARSAASSWSSPWPRSAAGCGRGQTFEDRERGRIAAPPAIDPRSSLALLRWHELRRRPPPGSWPGWRRGCSTPTSAACCTATSSRPTSCSAPTASRCCSTSTWPRRPAEQAQAHGHAGRHGRLHGPGAPPRPGRARPRPGPAGRPARRHLLAGHGPVRDAGRPAARSTRAAATRRCRR